MYACHMPYAMYVIYAKYFIYDIYDMYGALTYTICMWERGLFQWCNIDQAQTGAWPVNNSLLTIYIRTIRYFYLFSSLCIWGMAESPRRVVEAKLTWYFSFNLTSWQFMSFRGNISLLLSYFRQFLANLRHNDYLLSLRFTSFSITRALSYEM